MLCLPVIFRFMLLYTYCFKGNDFMKKIVLSWSLAGSTISRVWTNDLHKSI